ncbi:MAG: hypothetical protein C4526_12160 [Nitrospiraceae bacterium]|nr:MAG: hypothetical protein C4526_12160 [Nitrospiraceae bacterium]
MMNLKEEGQEVRSRVTLNEIPGRFLEWLVSSRTKFLNDMLEGKPMRYFSAHLPVMATWREGDPFPVNMTVKGIGLIPKDECIQDYTDMFEAVIAESRTKSWEESLHKRIGVMNKLYNDAGCFNPALLGGLEIFEGKAYENLRENPHTSLLYVGMAHSPHGMQYTSFQVNGEVELLDKNNPYYRFLLASRKLFEFEKFHLYQPDYPFGYLINVIEVRDKSPWSRNK